MTTQTVYTISEIGRRYGNTQYFNQSAAKMRHWARALAGVRVNAADARLLFVGDSTTAGIGGTVGNSSNGGGPYAAPYQVASILNRGTAPAARGLAVPPSPGNLDSRWTRPAAWTISGGYGWGKNACYGWPAGGTVADLTFADSVIADRYDIYYLVGTGLGSFTATATGGSGVIQATSGTNGIAKVTIAAGGESTSNTVTITPSNNGAVYIIGIEPWRSAVYQIRAANAGVGGSTATDWVSTSTSGRGGIDAIKAYAPDLTVISLGLNDASLSTDAPTFVSNIQTLIAAARVSGDVLLSTTLPPTSSATTVRQTYVPLYNAALAALGEPLVDFTARFGSGDSQNMLGMMTDSVHPTALGYADIAQTISTIISRV